jgi:glycine cleavage system H protein
MTAVPAELRYTTDHEWVRADGATWTVGITEHAACALGDIVFLLPPPAGTSVRKGVPCGEIESTKSVSDVCAPADGRVVAVNEEAVADPTSVNRDPYGDGWLFRMTAEGEGDLLDADEYAALVGADA